MSSTRSSREAQGLRRQCHYVGLRDRLVFADGQGHIPVREFWRPGGTKASRGTLQSSEHARIGIPRPARCRATMLRALLEAMARRGYANPDRRRVPRFADLDGRARTIFACAIPPCSARRRGRGELMCRPSPNDGAHVGPPAPRATCGPTPSRSATSSGWRAATGDAPLADLRSRLVDQVHQMLGRHRADDARARLDQRARRRSRRAHPTRGGLRIGKPLPERDAGEPFDERARVGPRRPVLPLPDASGCTRSIRSPARLGEPLLRPLGARARRRRRTARFVRHAPGRARRMDWKMSSRSVAAARARRWGSTIRSTARHVRRAAATAAWLGGAPAGTWNDRGAQTSPR